jgi:hypothetical protein
MQDNSQLPLPISAEPTIQTPLQKTPLQKRVVSLGRWLEAGLYFIGKHWKVLIGIALVVFGFLVIFLEVRKLINLNQKLKLEVSETRAAYVQDMQQITQSFEQQRAAQERIEREFRERLEELNRDYQLQLTKVSQARRIRQRQIESSPSQLPQTFQNVFGIPVRSEQE